MIVDQAYVNNLIVKLKTFYIRVSNSHVVKHGNGIIDKKNKKDVKRLYTLLKLLENYDVDQDYFDEDFILYVEREYKHTCAKNINSKYNVIYPLSNFRASAITSSQLTLTWVYNENSSTEYEIYTSLDGVNFSLISTLITKTYDHTGLIHNTLYYYRIRASENGIYSDFVTTTARTIHNTPSNFVSTVVSSSSIDLSWTDNNSGESGYQIDISTDNITFSPLTTTVANIESYNATGLVEGVQYYFRIQAVNSIFNNNSEYATDNSITKLITPTGLVISNVGATTLDLNWTDNSSVEDNYVIEVSSDGISFSIHSTIAANSISESITGLAEGIEYYYRVKATNGTTESDYSNIDNDTTILAVPTSLVATAHTDTIINLTWNDNSSAEINYAIERSLTSGSGFSLIATIAANSTSYQDTGLTEETQYYYRVRALGTTVNSVYSNEADDTTLFAFMMNTDIDSSLNIFSIVYSYSGVDLPKLYFEDGSEVVGATGLNKTISTSANGLNGTQQEVKLLVLDKSLVTRISFGANEINGSIDFTGLDNLTYLEIDSNNITSIVYPNLTGVTNFILKNNSINHAIDLSGIQIASGAIVYLENNSIPSIISPDCSVGSLFDYRISSNSLTGNLDFSGLVFDDDALFLFNNNSGVTGFTKPTTATGSIYRLGAYSLTSFSGTIDLSNFIPSSSAGWQIFSMNGLTDVINPASMGGGLFQYYEIFFCSAFTGTNGGGNNFDASWMDFTSGGSLKIQVTSIQTFSMPSSLSSTLKTLLLNANTSITDFDISTLPSGATSVNNASYNLTACSLSAAEVNQALVDFDTISVGGFSGRVISIGAGNGAPDSSSGGNDGDAAVTSLVSKGFTVTTA